MAIATQNEFNEENFLMHHEDIQSLIQPVSQHKKQNPSKKNEMYNKK